MNQVQAFFWLLDKVDALVYAAWGIVVVLALLAIWRWNR